MFFNMKRSQRRNLLAGELLIKVEAASLNRADLGLAQGNLPYFYRRAADYSWA